MELAKSSGTDLKGFFFSITLDIFTLILSKFKTKIFIDICNKISPKIKKNPTKCHLCHLWSELEPYFKLRADLKKAQLDLSNTPLCVIHCTIRFTLISSQVQNSPIDQSEMQSHRNKRPELDNFVITSPSLASCDTISFPTVVVNPQSPIVIPPSNGRFARNFHQQRTCHTVWWTARVLHCLSNSLLLFATLR